MKDWSDVTREFVEGIFETCKVIFEGYSQVPGCSYMKAICLMKKERVMSLEIFDQLNCDEDGYVSQFVKNLRVHLEDILFGRNFPTFSGSNEKE